MKIINEGTFGVIYEKDDNTIVKEYKKRSDVQEIIFLKSLQSNYLIPSRDIIYSQYLGIGLEKADNSIIDYIEELSYDDLFKAFKQVSQAVQVLHSENILHRDIKPDNILFIKKEDQINFMLSDFGLTVKTDDICFAPSLKVSGTINYLSPKLLAYDLKLEKNCQLEGYHQRYTCICSYHDDLWALGIAFLSLFYNRSFFERHQLRNIQKIKDTRELIRLYKYQIEKFTKIYKGTELEDECYKLINISETKRTNNQSASSYFSRYINLSSVLYKDKFPVFEDLLMRCSFDTYIHCVNLFHHLCCKFDHPPELLFCVCIYFYSKIYNNKKLFLDTFGCTPITFNEPKSQDGTIDCCVLEFTTQIIDRHTPDLQKKISLVGVKQRPDFREIFMNNISTFSNLVVEVLRMTDGVLLMCSSDINKIKDELKNEWRDCIS